MLRFRPFLLGNTKTESRKKSSRIIWKITVWVLSVLCSYCDVGISFGDSRCSLANLLKEVGFYSLSLSITAIDQLTSKAWPRNVWSNISSFWKFCDFEDFGYNDLQNVYRPNIAITIFLLFRSYFEPTLSLPSCSVKVLFRIFILPRNNHFFENINTKSSWYCLLHFSEKFQKASILSGTFFRTNIRKIRDDSFASCFFSVKESHQDFLWDSSIYI